MLGTTFHEPAHCLERPSLFRPCPYSQQYIRAEAIKLDELLQYNLQSVRSRLMKEDFQQFCEYNYAASAGKFLGAWCTRAMRKKIKPLKDFAKTLRKKRDLLLHWFRADGALLSGIGEEFNNKLKRITRKSYGFRTQNAYEIALYRIP
ncbi:transposase [Novipirellula aureliae]|nr:transposase [Novipirellula aureliae]